MTWNHRVVRSVSAVDGTVAYTIREVFYEDDGKVSGWTADAIEPHGETLDELRQNIARMAECTDRPVLDEDELQADAEETP